MLEFILLQVNGRFCRTANGKHNNNNGLQSNADERFKSEESFAFDYKKISYWKETIYSNTNTNTTDRQVTGHLHDSLISRSSSV